MTKRIVPILIILLIMCCALSACNTSTNESTTAGITLSGRMLCDDQPLSGVKVFHGDNVAYSNEYGIFVLSNLDKQDVVYFALDGYNFKPDKIVATNNIYDLEIVATKTEKQPDENQDKPSGDGDVETKSDDDDPNVKPNDDNPTIPEEKDEPEQDENQDDEIAPNCTNGALIIQNSTIKFMFCVDNDFSTLVFSTLKNGVETVIAPIYSKEKDLTVDGKTLQLYYADVSSFVDKNETEFFVKASTEKYATGTVASTTYHPSVLTTNPVLTLAGNMLEWAAIEDGANYKVLVNGVIVSSTTSTSFDLSTVNMQTSYTVQIRAEYKNGLISYSNIVEINVAE